VNNKKDSTITDEVQSRLEDIFEESEKTHTNVEEGGEPQDSPLKGLKTVLLSIEWEITDEAMATLIGELDKLEDKYKDDKNLLLFLRLLATAGKYIKSRKANTHPGAIRMLNSVYKSLEIVLLSKGITEAEKKKILNTHVKEFKKLKEQIALRKASKVKEKKVKPPEETREELMRDMSHMTPQEVLAYVLDEVKQVIRDEFKALKEELKSRDL
jgi:hypothetical protein